MKIGFAQFDCKLGDKKTNLENIERLIQKAKADILVFPELALTGYSFQDQDEIVPLAEEIPHGESIQAFIRIARKNDCLMIAGLIESKFYDTTIAVGPKGYLGKAQKMHLFLRERELFLPGGTKPLLVSWKGIRIGIGVCYDYMFPEYWRNLALRGADLFCNTANFVYDYGFKIMQVRAIENGVYSICTNRVGTERITSFRGGSEIIDNRGSIIAKGVSEEDVIVVDVDLKKSRDKKWNPYNDLLKDRRPEMY